MCESLLTILYINKSLCFNYIIFPYIYFYFLTQFFYILRSFIFEHLMITNITTNIHIVNKGPLYLQDRSLANPCYTVRSPYRIQLAAGEQQVTVFLALPGVGRVYDDCTASLIWRYNCVSSWIWCK